VQAAPVGIIGAIGYQGFASVCNAILYWVIMLPLTYALVFPLGLGYTGVLLGLPIASTLQMFIFIGLQ